MYQAYNSRTRIHDLFPIILFFLEKVECYRLVWFFNDWRVYWISCTLNFNIASTRFELLKQLKLRMRRMLYAESAQAIAWAAWAVPTALCYNYNLWYCPSINDR